MALGSDRPASAIVQTSPGTLWGVRGQSQSMSNMDLERQVVDNAPVQHAEEEGFRPNTGTTSGPPCSLGCAEGR